jgi:hypothetical protein
MAPYAGQTMTTGAQAEAYADHFIAYHLSLIGGGKTYSQLSAEAMAQPNNTALAGEVATVFKGTTLRSMLLQVYGIGTIGQIALIAAICSYAAAGLMLILSIFGSSTCGAPSPNARSCPPWPPASRSTSANPDPHAGLTSGLGAPQRTRGAGPFLASDVRRTVWDERPVGW